MKKALFCILAAVLTAVAALAAPKTTTAMRIHLRMFLFMTNVSYRLMFLLFEKRKFTENPVNLHFQEGDKF